jgi:hypothetical protein
MLGQSEGLEAEGKTLGLCLAIRFTLRKTVFYRKSRLAAMGTQFFPHLPGAFAAPNRWRTGWIFCTSAAQPGMPVGPAEHSGAVQSECFTKIF